MPTNRTFVRQVQLTGSLAQNDNLSFTTRDDVVSGSLEHDLNAMRTVIRKMIGNAPDDGTTFGQGWWYTDSANGVNLSTLNTAISGTFQINELYVSGSGHSVISGSLWVEQLSVGDGSTGMVVEGDTLEVTGSMFVSSSLQVSGAVKFDLIDDPATPETSMFQVFSPNGTRVFMVSGSTGGSFMVLSGSDGGGTSSGINLVGGATAWSDFESTFGTNTSIIEAFNFLYNNAGGELKGTLNTTGGVVADTAIDVNVGGYTYLGTANTGDPALQMDVFVNGLLMSGTTGFVTDDSDWYSTNDANAPGSSVANQIAFNFDIDNQDIVQVLIKKSQLV